jgi:hypothetical protein
MRIRLILGLAFLLPLGASIGCHNSGSSASTVSSSHVVTNVQAKDINQADAYRESLPRQLNLSSDQVIVKPAAGYMRVTILNVRSSSEQQRIAGILQRLNDANPKLDSLRVRFR